MNVALLARIICQENEDQRDAYETSVMKEFLEPAGLVTHTPIHSKHSSTVEATWLHLSVFFPVCFGFPVSEFRFFSCSTLANQPQIMAYYLLTVLEQDDGVEVQRLVKDLVRSRVRNLV